METVRSIYIEKNSTLPAKTKIDKPVNFNNNQMVLRIAVGAGVVTIILFLVFIGYRIYTKRRKQNTKRCNSYQSSLPSQVTLLPIHTVRSESEQPEISKDLK